MTNQGNEVLEKRLAKDREELARLQSQYKEARLNNDDGAEIVKQLRDQIKKKENVIKVIKQAIEGSKRSTRL